MRSPSGSVAEEVYIAYLFWWIRIGPFGAVGVAGGRFNRQPATRNSMYSSTLAFVVDILGLVGGGVKLPTGQMAGRNWGAARRSGAMPDIRAAMRGVNPGVTAGFNAGHNSAVNAAINLAVNVAINQALSPPVSSATNAGSSAASNRAETREFSTAVSQDLNATLSPAVNRASSRTASSGVTYAFSRELSPALNRASSLQLNVALSAEANSAVPVRVA
jgi:hypothetical protein